MSLVFDRRVSWLALFVLGLCAGGAASLTGSAYAAICPNEQRRAEQPYGLALPDCRAYEMVTPLEKNDTDGIESFGIEARAAVSGDAIVYGSLTIYGEPAGGYIRGTYLSSRGPEGWSDRNIAPPLEPGNTLQSPGAEASFLDLTFTPDLSKGMVTRANTQLAGGVTPGYEESFLADLVTGSYRLVSQIPGTHEGVRTGQPYAEQGEAPEVVGASTDLSHVVYAASQIGGSVDEWVNGESYAVSVANNGEAMSAAAGSGNARGTGFVTNDANVWHAVSADGSRVYMTSPTGNGQSNRELFVRVNPEKPQSPLDGSGKCTDPVDACTILVSASQRNKADPNASSSPTFFWGASADGSRAFFTSSAELTEDANTGPADNAPNLYEYDLNSGKLTDLSVDSTDQYGAGVLGVVQISDDGSYVYFVTEGVLAKHGVSGGANLYVSHDGGAATFVATLENGGGKLFQRGTEEGDEETYLEGPTLNEAAISQDGTRLAFDSKGSLTGYDSRASTCSYYKESRCSEVYLYDVSTGNLACVSCNPSGARPVGSSVLNTPSRFTELPEYRLNSLSEDGSRLFFDSPDALVTHDTNGRRDVYEYQDGHVYPISNVAGNYDSLFVDAGANGDNVFIATGDNLLAQDQGSLVDVYDARVGGGFPVVAPATECDNGDSCKGQVSPRPGVFGAPASATFSGAGNAASTPPIKSTVRARSKSIRCKTGYARRRSKCVKTRARRSRAHIKTGRRK